VKKKIKKKFQQKNWKYVSVDSVFCADSKYVVSFDYPSDWIYDEKTTNTLSGADRITVALKESQYKKGMGTSWMNVSVVNSLDAKDITVFGNKVNVSSVNGIRADVWENQSTNQKYLVFQSNGKTYVIQSRTTYKDDNLEDIYRHLLESFNTNPQ